MKRNTLLILVLVSAGLFALAAEIIVRHSRPDLNNERQYRQAHCFDRYLLLCPSTSGQFTRPDGSLWTMTTDARGERIVPEHRQGLPEVWWIGDSISMGYLLDDVQTPPYRFAMLGYNVRNLGSDSVGTAGIAYRLQQALHRSDRRPVHIFWIYNTSDFADDIKELRFQKNPALQLAFRLHYELSRKSSLYLFLRSKPGDLNQLPPGFDAAPADDHPTFTNLLSLASMIEDSGLTLTILVYPGMDPRTGKAALQDPTTAKLVRFLQKNRRQKDGLPVFDVIDLRPDFARLEKSGHSLYIRGDGHPAEEAARLFADTAHQYMKRIYSLPQN